MIAICYFRESIELLSESRLRQMRTVCAWVYQSYGGSGCVLLRRLLCGVNDGIILLRWRQNYSCGDTVTEVKTFCSLGDENFIDCSDCVTERIKRCYWRDDGVLWRWQQWTAEEEHALILKNVPFLLFYSIQHRSSLFPDDGNKNNFFATFCFLRKNI